MLCSFLYRIVVQAATLNLLGGSCKAKSVLLSHFVQAVNLFTWSGFYYEKVYYLEHSDQVKICFLKLFLLPIPHDN